MNKTYKQLDLLDFICLGMGLLLLWSVIMHLVVFSFTISTALDTNMFAETAKWNVTSNNNHEWHHIISNNSFSRKRTNLQAKDSLQHKRIVIIGDSVTRYQYMNLINFLHFNSWISERPWIEWEHEWIKHDGIVNGSDGRLLGDWQEYFVGTSARFGGAEFCDCSRLAVPGVLKENRHYHDSRHNLSISFFLWFPPTFPVQVLPVPSARDFYSLRSEPWSRGCSSLNASFTSTFGNINLFLTEFIKPLVPDYVIINQGFWEYPSIHNSTSGLQDFVAALKASSRKAIWKTTTATHQCGGETAPENSTFLTFLKSSGIDVYDAFSFTKGVSIKSDAYFDGVHFQPFVYRELNKRLLEMIK